MNSAVGKNPCIRSMNRNPYPFNHLYQKHHPQIKKYLFLVLFLKEGRMFLRVDEKALEAERLDINLLVGMNGFMAFAESPKFNVEHAGLVILSHLMKM